jgi:hypothetical protein
MKCDFHAHTVSSDGEVSRAAKDAPAGDHSVELEMEAVNLHVAPGRNLLLRVPLKVKVVP